MSDSVRNLIIIGSGPSGYTAAVYAARANLEPLVFEGSVTAGGALMNTTDVENFPGFPDGIMGPDLMDKLRAQSERFGAELISDDVTAVDLDRRHQDRHARRRHDLPALAPSCSRWARATASSRSRARTGCPATASSWCATCDGFFFREQNIVVVGGGDSALEEATFLTRFASKVTMVHRRDELRGSKIMQDRAFANDKIEFAWNAEVAEMHGEDKLEGITLRDTVTGELRRIDATGLFIAIGHDPRSELLKGQVELDDEGYVLVQPGSTATNLPGVFAAGDLVDHTYRQAITAAGTGCAASLDAERYLADLEHAGAPAPGRGAGGITTAPRR